MRLVKLNRIVNFLFHILSHRWLSIWNCQLIRWISMCNCDMKVHVQKRLSGVKILRNFAYFLNFYWIVMVANISWNLFAVKLILPMSRQYQIIYCKTNSEWLDQIFVLNLSKMNREDVVLDFVVVSHLMNSQLYLINLNLLKKMNKSDNSIENNVFFVIIVIIVIIVLWYIYLQFMMNHIFLL